jgi:hypothetical protein
MIKKIVELWEKLPKPIKVAFYLAGAGLLSEFASALLGSKQLDLITFFKVAVANILLVIVAEIKELVGTKPVE